jgi:hypothetical protein
MCTRRPPRALANYTLSGPRKPAGYSRARLRGPRHHYESPTANSFLRSRRCPIRRVGISDHTLVRCFKQPPVQQPQRERPARRAGPSRGSPLCFPGPSWSAYDGAPGPLASSIPFAAAPRARTAPVLEGAEHLPHVRRAANCRLPKHRFAPSPKHQILARIASQPGRAFLWSQPGRPPSFTPRLKNPISAPGGARISVEPYDIESSEAQKSALRGARPCSLQLAPHPPLGGPFSPNPPKPLHSSHSNRYATRQQDQDPESLLACHRRRSRQTARQTALHPPTRCSR